ncbi:hypothetical protein CU669_00050 [Paramagnetospirillum kuznetsovii]|uniref:LPS-assembly lipoprotein n=1 Tax=Paramagnetospirillum kuznetsovii TaxID=2053833 RepID=A0A364P2M1_9PROT|nr:LPS assembly lipoprotein LptE [Paramagnetospirillum kuznetsovii]RAU23536.1 hypothetical protein CU669_00050 [Paramagnetospirillum kuznetsovii]
MWWSRAVLLLALLALGPVGCGFSPIYAKGGRADGSSVSADLALIRVSPIKDRLGQQLRNALVRRFNPQGEPAEYTYDLQVEVSQTSTDLGYRRDALATLGRMAVRASYSLTGNGVVVATNSVEAIVYFDYLGPRYASVAVERDAEERAIIQLSDEIRTIVASSLARYKSNPQDARFRRTGELDTFKPLERR